MNAISVGRRLLWCDWPEYVTALPLVSTWLALVLGAERVIAGGMTVMMMKRVGSG